MSKLLTIHLTMKGRTKPFKYKEEVHKALDGMIEDNKIMVNLITLNKFGEDVEVILSCDVTKIEEDNIYAILDEEGENEFKKARQSGNTKIINFEEYRKNK